MSLSFVFNLISILVLTDVHDPEESKFLVQLISLVEGISIVIFLVAIRDKITEALERVVFKGLASQWSYVEKE